MEDAIVRSGTFRVQVPSALFVLMLGVLLTCSAGVGSAAVPASQGDSRWVLPGLLDPATNKRAEQPVVDTGPDGTTVMAWVQYTYSNSSVIRARIKEPGGSFGPAQVLSVERPNATVMDPRVDVGEDGSVGVAWAYWDLWAEAGPSIVVRAAFRPGGGDFGPQQPVSLGDGSWRAPRHQVATGKGSAQIVWVQSEGGRDVIKRSRLDGNGVVNQSSLRAHQGFIGEERLTSDAADPIIDIGGGVGIIVWRELVDVPAKLPHGPGQTVMLTRIDGSTGNVIETKRLTPMATRPAEADDWVWVPENGPADVAVDGEGRSLIVWPAKTRIEIWNSRAGERIDEVSAPSIQAAEYDRAGGLVRPRYSIGPATGAERDVSVELAENGSAAAIWNRGDGYWDIVAEPDASADIFVAVRRAGDPQLTVSRVKASSGRVAFTDVDVSTDGEATAIWTRGADGNSMVESRRVNPDGSLEPTIRMSDLTGSPYGLLSPGSYTNPLESSIAVGPDGHAHAAWSTQPDHRRIQWTTTDRDPELRLQVEFSGEGSGRVTSQPAVLDCAEDCTASGRFMESIRLTAHASPGSEFVGWEGGCLATDGSVCEVRMGGDTTVRAVFARAFKLGVSQVGRGDGKVVSSPGGIDCGTDCEEVFREGKMVTLHAQPASGSTFVSWSGACTGGQPSCEVKMSEAQNVNAEFSRFFNLQVSRNGLGSVTSEPAGINCSTSSRLCLKAFEIGTRVTLTATPEEGSGFIGWAGDCSGNQPACVIEIDSSTVVGASFTSGFELVSNIMSIGSGSVSVTDGSMNCSPSICRGEFAPGSRVELAANGKPGFAFAGWSGACEVNGDTCVVVMDEAREVTANFDPGEKLSVSFSGEGTGRVTSDPGGIDCVPGSICEGWFLLGSEVVLNAVPAPGSVFAGWERSDPADYTGGCAGTEASCVASVGVPVRVVARFEPEPPEPEPDRVVEETSEDEGPGDPECTAPGLRVSQVRQSRGGTAILKLGATRPGVAVVRGPQIRRTRAKVAPGWSRVKVRASVRLARKLTRSKALRARVSVRLVAAGCESTASRARILLRG